MGIFSTIKKQFIPVIDWTEEGNTTLVHRYPMIDREIQNGGQLTVRETQMALFVNEGEIADLFGPGLHTLTTKNLPMLTVMNNWDKAFNSPFKSDVYFFSMREHIDQKWGTPTPITLRDKEMGAIRLRAFGTYSYKIKNPQIFFKKISGTQEKYSITELEGQLRSTITTSIAAFFGQSGIAFIDMASNQMKFSDTLKEAMVPSFANYGLELSSFFVQSISLPEELQAYFDKAAQMRLLGDLGQYAQFQSAESISIAAANPGGAAGAGIGLGAGMAMGQTMASALSGANSGHNSEDPTSLLEKLHDLMKKGVLSESEYNEKKVELLKKIK
jgi:membrane protease subunit (stomatin/prohibitin family)